MRRYLLLFIPSLSLAGGMSTTSNMEIMIIGLVIVGLIGLFLLLEAGIRFISSKISGKGLRGIKAIQLVGAAIGASYTLHEEPSAASVVGTYAPEYPGGLSSFNPATFPYGYSRQCEKHSSVPAR